MKDNITLNKRQRKLKGQPNICNTDPKSTLGTRLNKDKSNKKHTGNLKDEQQEPF